jgi:uncharacterized protein (TIGR00270 family)
MQCEMCGGKGNLISATIEGVDLKVCASCSKLGVVKKQVIVKAKPIIKQKEQIEYFVVPGAGKMIKEFREQRGMRQIDLAKMLQMKDSLLHLIETEHLPLNLPMAKHIEEIIGLQLVKPGKV